MQRRSLRRLNSLHTTTEAGKVFEIASIVQPVRKGNFYSFLYVNFLHVENTSLKMECALMAICILMALTLPGFIHGRPAIDNNGSMLSMSVTRASKPEHLLDYERKAILQSDSTPVEENASFPIKSRQKRLSDQRRAELETLMTLSRIACSNTDKRSAVIIVAEGNPGMLDPIKIGRRRRFTLDQIPTELVPIHHIDKQKHDGDPAYPLVS